MFYNSNPGNETGQYVYPTPPIQQQPQTLNVNNMYPTQGNFQQNPLVNPPPQFNPVTPSLISNNSPNNGNTEELIQVAVTKTPIKMPLPLKNGIPEGLEHFADLDELFVKRKAEYLPIMSEYEKNKKYFILNGKGEKIYFVAGDEDEENDCDCWCCCKGYDPSSPFKMTIIDFSGKPVLLFERTRDWPLYFRSFCKDCTCTCCWFKSTKGRMLVKLPDGTRLGEIIDIHGVSQPNYEINDAEGQLVIRIGFETQSSVFAMLKGGLIPEHTPELLVKREDGALLGSIKNKFWEEGDTLGVKFPANLDLELKTLIFACIFLMDFKYSEVHRLTTVHRHVWQ